jgi:hypothetical protein
MPKLYTLLTCFFTLQMLNAQDFQWVNHTTSTGSIQINFTDFLPDGSTINAGYFSGTADLDPGPGAHVATASGGTDIFITLLDAAGTFQWTQIIGGGVGFESIAGVKVDPSGQIICLGHFEGTANIPGNGIQTSLGFEDIYILSLSFDGTTQWFKKLGNASSNVVSDFTLDMEHNIVVTGYFADTMDFDPGAGVAEKTSAGSWDVYILKLTSTGDYIWSEKIGSSELDQPFQICTTPAGAIAVTFRLNGNSIYLESPTDMPPAESQALCTMQMDANGQVMWLNQVANAYASQLHVKALESDGDGNIIQAGVFTGSRDFDPSNAVLQLSSITGYYDGYILKTNSAGQVQWAKQIGGYEEDMIQAMCIDQENHIHLTGFFMSQTMDIAPEEEVTQTLTRVGTHDFFQVRLSSEGNYEQHIQLSTTSMVKGIGLINNGEDQVIVSIVFNGTIALTVDGVIQEFTQPAGFGSLVANSTYCFPNMEEVEILACGSYTSPSGSYVWDQTGIYQDVILNEGGCDSTITIQLTIQEIEAAILQDDEALMATYDNATYKWIDCGDNFEFIPGADEQFFTPSVTGTYAVQVTVNGCSEISDCVEYTVAHTAEAIVLDKWHVYPNPNNGTFTIPKTAIREAYEIRIVDAYGKLIQRQRAISNSNIEVQFDAPAGIYHVQLLDKNNVRSTQIVKY